MVPGVRIENFSQEITYDVINIPPDDPGFSRTTETLFLPSFNVKFAINEDSNLRFAFSKTASIPEFKEAAPFVYEDVTIRYGGNPDLLGSSNPDFVNVSDKGYSDGDTEWELAHLLGYAGQSDAERASNAGQMMVEAMAERSIEQPFVVALGYPRTYAGFHVSEAAFREAIAGSPVQLVESLPIDWGSQNAYDQMLIMLDSLIKEGIAFETHGRGLIHRRDLYHPAYSLEQGVYRLLQIVETVAHIAP